MTVLRRNAPVLAIVLGCWLAVTVACEVLTRAAFAAGVRRLLAVHFVRRLEDPAGEALWIWLHNSKLTVGVALAIAAVALVRPVAPSFVWFFDGCLVLWAMVQAALAGVLLGAYGSPQLQAFLPDGPVEVTGWALLLALYINARRGDGWRQTALGLVWVQALLALAAILEAFGGGWL
jgi:hypothetical protein